MPAPENILAKAHKLLALIHHPSTPAGEASNARTILSQLLATHNLTELDILTTTRSERRIVFANEDDKILIATLIFHMTDDYDHEVRFNANTKELITDLTDKEFSLLAEMIAFYRVEFLKTIKTLDSSVETIKRALKSAIAARKKALTGFVHKQNLFATPKKMKEEPPQQKYTPEELEAIRSAMDATHRKAFTPTQQKINQSREA